MEELIKYINNPALVILLSEVLVIMSFLILFMWFKNSYSKRKALRSLKNLANDIKQNNDTYKTKISDLLSSKDTNDPAAIEEGLKKLLDSQERLVKDLMMAVRTRDNDIVSTLGESINDVVVEAVNIGRVSGEGNTEKLEQENEELTEKLDDASTQMNSLMKEYKSMFPEEDGESENASAEVVSQEAEQEDNNTLMDISDDLEELDNAISQVAEEKTEQQETETSETNTEEGESINLDDIDIASDEAANESEDEEKAA